MLTPLRRERQVAEEQRVIDDQDLGVLHAPAGGVVEALFVRRTLAAHAVAAVAGHFVPHAGSGLDDRSLSEPSCGRFAHASMSRSCANSSSLLNRLLARSIAAPQPPQAEVVAASLDQHGGELARDHAVRAAASPSRSAALAG